MRKFFKIIAIIMIMGLFALTAKSQSIFKPLTLLATQPFSMENRGKFSRKPACRKLRKLYKQLNNKANRMKNEYMDSQDDALLKSIITTSRQSYKLKSKHHKKCRTRTAKAVHGGFRDTVRKLQIELQSRDIPVSIFQYPTPEDMEDKGLIELKIEERTVELRQLLQDLENTQELILSLYKKTFANKPEANKTAASTAESNSSAAGAEDLDDLEEDTGVSNFMSGDYEVIANAEMRSLFKNMYDLTLTDGKRNFIPKPLQAPQEVEVLDLLFSHYYHIRKESAASQTLRIHLFFMDSTQLDKATKLYPVYSKKTNPMPWKGRKTDYVGNLSKELNFVAEKFATKQ